MSILLSVSAMNSVRNGIKKLNLAGVTVTI